jgi:transducin (beta)-like 1
LAKKDAPKEPPSPLPSFAPPVLFFSPGFHHAAFTLGHEANLHTSSLNPHDIPPGALITFLQKGLQYLELEVNLNDTATDLEGDFSLLTPRELMTKTAAELKGLVRAKKTIMEKQRAQLVSVEEKVDPEVIPEDKALALDGLNGEVFVCQWHPFSFHLGAAGGDGSARVWELPESALEGNDTATLVGHLEVAKPRRFGHAGRGAEQKDVTALHWGPTGEHLVTGGYDGVIKLWDDDGDLRSVLEKHVGAVFTVQFAPCGTLLLSGGADSITYVWDLEQGEVIEEYTHHKDAVLDAVWRDDSEFVSCSKDHLIQVVKRSEPGAGPTLSGHTKDVNNVRYSADLTTIATCSDDKMVGVWNADTGTCGHLMKGHKKEVYSVAWSPPSGAGTTIASASFDATAKIWDPERGCVLHSLARHKQAVYAVAYSPDGRSVAKGSFDKTVLVWSLATGEVTRSFKTEGAIFDVQWHQSGHFLAAAGGDALVNVLDVRV